MVGQFLSLGYILVAKRALSHLRQDGRIPMKLKQLHMTSIVCKCSPVSYEAQVMDM